MVRCLLTDIVFFCGCIVHGGVESICACVRYMFRVLVLVSVFELVVADVSV